VSTELIRKDGRPPLRFGCARRVGNPETVLVGDQAWDQEEIFHEAIYPTELTSHPISLSSIIDGCPHFSPVASRSVLPLTGIIVNGAD